VDHSRGCDHVAEGQARLGVEVDAEFVRLVRLCGSDRPRVEDDGAHLGRPGHVGKVGWAQLVRRAPAREGDGCAFHPRGYAASGDAFLEEHLALDAVREALEGGRAVVEGAHDAVADCQVVLEDVPLGVAGLGEDDLVRAAQPYRTAGDLDLDGG
jgi:hypothetical protein